MDFEQSNGSFSGGSLSASENVLTSTPNAQAKGSRGHLPLRRCFKPKVKTIYGGSASSLRNSRLTERGMRRGCCVREMVDELT